MKERKRPGKRMWGTRRRRSGGTEEEGRVGNAHKRVRALRRKGRWEKIKSGGKNIRKTIGGRQRELGGGCGFPS